MKVIASADAFRHAFETERAQTYPAIDAFEQRLGVAIDRERLERAAEVLACPVKRNPPCWQHGRVIYAATRHLLATRATPSATLLDIGTAKGFSALCLLWAAVDAGLSDVEVYSCDVIDPRSHAIRNTVAEVRGLKTLAEILDPWPESHAIRFQHATGTRQLTQLLAMGAHVSVAFIDGKHDRDVVLDEGRLLAPLQQTGDLAIFDDCQIDGVQAAVNQLGAAYAFTPIEAKPDRAYAIGVRR